MHEFDYELDDEILDFNNEENEKHTIKRKTKSTTQWQIKAKELT